MNGYPPDPIPISQAPRLTPHSGPAPRLPPAFKCTAILHPFAPPPTSGPVEPSPFYQLCTANIAFSEGEFFSLQIKGAEYGTFWYLISPNSVKLSVNGADWQVLEGSGWVMPTRNWLVGSKPSCAGLSPINWIDKSIGKSSAWWKYAVPGSKKDTPGATWIWFDAKSGAESAVPQRVMFGVQPPTPTTGDRRQLAVLQNFSFSYFTHFEAGPVKQPSTWEDPVVTGFKPGNPFGFKPFLWRQNQGMTVFMTPVNENYDPLPTRVLYRWDPDHEFQHGGARGQNTLLHYDYPNQNHHSLELAILGRKPPKSEAEGYNAYYFNAQEPGKENQLDRTNSGPFPFGTQAPDWVTEGGGKIHATLASNPELGPNMSINIWGVLFPPATNYPQGTYLWTWYQPLDSVGVNSRPVTFMQSASALGVGTSLALADYFYFQAFAEPIKPDFFKIPPPDTLVWS